jgi:hypothetical protein
MLIQKIPFLHASSTAIVACLLVSSASVRADQVQMANANPFSVASVHFEQNVTDGDVEVVFNAKGGADGLSALKVVSPDGRTVINFSVPNASTMGMRQFRMETPEPKDVSALKAAYPEGTYAFSATTFSGTTYVGKNTLSHRLPATAKLRFPTPEAKDVPIENVEFSWDPVPGVDSYILEVEQDELNTSFTVNLPSSSTSLSLPNGFLKPGKEYQLGIATVTSDGNASFVETSFTTKN